MGHEYTNPFCRARLVPLLAEVSEAITDNRDLDDIMDRVVRLLVDNLPGTQRILLSIFNRSTGHILVEKAFGITDEEKARGVYRVGEGITGQVVQTGRPIIVPDISQESTFLNRTGSLTIGDAEGLAFICVPIKMGREIMGTLSIDRPTRQHASAAAKSAGSKGLPDCGPGRDFSLQQDLEVLSIISAMIAQAVGLQQARQEEANQLRQQNQRLLEELSARYHPSQIIGNSKPMQNLFKLLQKVYDKNTPVLILGETGCGKELVAQALHYNSLRATGPFIKFNCAAVPESLAESELFGHEKGAFTGATAQRSGRFEDADGGTLFLDEIGELSLTIQAKILRVVQQREFERLGGNRTVNVDIRLIAATNRDLPEMIKAGTFREDLYYRLNVFPLTIPPLRERGSDIMLLADHFVEKYATVHDSPVRRISSPSIEMLLAYHWPGNVRELENVIERAVILADDGVIHGYHLPPSLQTPESSGTKWFGNLEQKIESVERETIIEAIKATRGNMAQAARELGLTERVMALRMSKHRIDFRLYRAKA